MLDTYHVQLDDWLTRLFGHVVTRYGGPLTRIKQLAQALDLKPLAPHSIVVTGTNGKGSTVRLLEAIYLAAGYSVAAITSPHVMSFTERLTLNGQQVTEAAVVKAFEYVDTLCDRNTTNTFDFIYLALLWCVKQFKPQIAIIEAGVGGLYDVSNLFDADVAVITTIDLDHTDLLGDTRDKIAFQKAQLARRGHPIVCGDPHPPASLTTVVSEIGAKLYQLDGNDHGFTYSANVGDWGWSGPFQQYSNLPLPVIKLQNAATALMVMGCLQKALPVSEQAIINGLRAVRMLGRFEVYHNKQCPIILDVAHNPQACQWLAQQLQQQQPVTGRTLMVFAMAANKLLSLSLQPLIDCVDAWWVAPLARRKCYSSMEIKQELAALGIKNCYTNKNLEDALRAVLKLARASDRIVVCGSFCAVQEAMQFLGDRVNGE